MTMYNLKSELQYYRYFKFETKNFEKTVGFYGDIDESYELVPIFKNYNILITPFDWSRYTRPRKRLDDFEHDIFWSGFEEESLNENDNDVSESSYLDFQKENLPKTAVDLIKRGEGSRVEFKPSLLHDYKTRIRTERIKSIIVKVICSYLNSKGGFLLIGVNDKGIIDGLKNDFQYAPSTKDKRDFFKLEYNSMIRKFFPPKIIHYLSSNMIRIGKKEVFLIEVYPSNEPIFIKGEVGKEFYVRSEGASERILDIQHIVEYCLTHFKVENK